MGSTLNIGSGEAKAPSVSRPGVPAVSIVVPTRNEAGNVPRLLDVLGEVLPAGAAEIIFADDSDDATVAVVQAETASRRDMSITLIHREGEQRVGGLGGAVVAGMRVARAPWICVMD